MKRIYTTNFCINHKRVDEYQRMYVDGELFIGVLYKNGNTTFVGGADAEELWGKLISKKFKHLKHKSGIKNFKDFINEKRTTNLVA